MLSSSLYPRTSATRRVVDLSGFWKFQFDPESKGEAEGWTKKLPSPITMPVPASFADFFTDKDSREYTGDFWYETDFFVPAEWQGRTVAIRFDGVCHRGTVFVNDAEITSHEGGFLPFAADVSGTVNYGGSNRLVVLANNELSEKMLPAGRTETLPDGRKIAKPYFDFFNYAGIQRSVRLLALPKEAIRDLSMVHKINGNDAEIDYQIEHTGEGDVSVSVYDEEESEVASVNGSAGTISIPGAKLWKVRNAYLYRFVIRLHKNGVLLDEWYDDIGIRTVEIRGTEILLNGDSVYLKGFGKHEDSEFFGRGYNPAVWKRDFELLKWIGANSFRTSHYPYAEEVYQMADREGILVIDEVPAVGMHEISVASAGAGRDSGKPPFFSRETVPELLKNHLEAVRDMIRRDKNRACVIAWSLFNEPDSVDDSAVPYFEKVFETARSCDPQKRPRSFTLILNSGPDNCKCHKFCDFISLNRYFGWYLMSGIEIGKAEELMRKELESWKGKDLNKPVLYTEYGADCVAGIHKVPSVAWSEDYQVEVLEMNHKVFDCYDFVKGEQVWAFADFQTGEGLIRVDGNKKGVFTRQRQPKTAALYLKQRWDKLPLNYKAKE
jgi:beta-glucuronidase